MCTCVNFQFVGSVLMFKLFIFKTQTNLFDQPLHFLLFNKNQLYGIEHLLQNVVVCVVDDGDVGGRYGNMDNCGLSIDER